MKPTTIGLDEPTVPNVLVAADGYPQLGTGKEESTVVNIANRTEDEFAVGKHFVARRTRAPREELLSLLRIEEAGAMLGGQAEWFWGVPGVFQTRASPRAGHAVPAPPIRDHDEHNQALGYWKALHYLLLYRLGWSHPELGLMRWYDMEKPTDDATLALVSEIWDRDGHLDVYLAWLILLQRKLGPTAFLEAGGVGTTNTASTDLSGPWEVWLEKTIEQSSRTPAPWFPLTGGWDELHLTRHPGEEGRPDPEATLTVVDATQAQAVYLTGAMDAWNGDLRRRIKTLPPSPRSWRVEVIVRSVGSLGTFRRSRATGLVFTGRHRYHALGN